MPMSYCMSSRVPFTCSAEKKEVLVYFGVGAVGHDACMAADGAQFKIPGLVPQKTNRILEETKANKDGQVKQA